MWEVWVWFQGWHSRVRGLGGGGGRLDGVGRTRKGVLWLGWDGAVRWEVRRGDETECLYFEHTVEALQY